MHVVLIKGPQTFKLCAAVRHFFAHLMHHWLRLLSATQEPLINFCQKACLSCCYLLWKTLEFDLLPSCSRLKVLILLHQKGTRHHMEQVCSTTVLLGNPHGILLLWTARDSTFHHLRPWPARGSVEIRGPVWAETDLTEEESSFMRLHQHCLFLMFSDSTQLLQMRYQTQCTWAPKPHLQCVIFTCCTRNIKVTVLGLISGCYFNTLHRSTYLIRVVDSVKKNYFIDSK